jgi:hypothetical protein
LTKKVTKKVRNGKEVLPRETHRAYPARKGFRLFWLYLSLRPDLDTLLLFLSWLVSL